MKKPIFKALSVLLLLLPAIYAVVAGCSGNKALLDGQEGFVLILAAAYGAVSLFAGKRFWIWTLVYLPCSVLYPMISVWSGIRFRVSKNLFAFLRTYLVRYCLEDIIIAISVVVLIHAVGTIGIFLYRKRAV